ANSKTVLNAKYAKKEVKDKVIRADQLVKYIKDKYESSKEAALSDEKLLVWAQSYMKLHKEQEKNYSEKYERYRINVNTHEENLAQEHLAIDIESNTILEVAATVEELEGVKVTGVNNKFDELKDKRVIKENDELKETGVIKEIDALKETDIFKELRAYRLNKSREENCKPYIIYNDNQLRDLITKMPRNREEIRKVSGFGEVKVSKYGDDILEIVRKY
ncbi:MAG TPA: HRDC domain-containing protein, partial [Lachnospiraceae bacterium]|nr:HRDC domain-containing protein [Lachnospiraceae bacterium]